ncbi:Sensor protein SrrB [compost metagenome]
MITVTSTFSSVHKLLMLASKQASPTAQAKQITIKLPQDENIYANFDLKWTVEALFNIIDNAIKYTKQGDQIDIFVTTYEFFCRIDITDHGIGIAEAEQSAVFRRFYRSPAVSMQEGVGLGLYLAREIITAEGGYIKLSSQASVGSTFSIFLPLR